MTTRTGTNYFLSKFRASGYYIDQYDEAEINRKIDEGEIIIGKPPLAEGETLEIEGGRYFIIREDKRMGDITINKELEGKTLYRNFYLCSECSTEWQDVWDSMCNDHCPNCDAEIEPYRSEEGTVYPEKATLKTWGERATAIKAAIKDIKDEAAQTATMVLNDMAEVAKIEIDIDIRIKTYNKAVGDLISGLFK